MKKLVTNKITWIVLGVIVVLAAVLVINFPFASDVKQPATKEEDKQSQLEVVEEVPDEETETENKTDVSGQWGTDDTDKNESTTTDSKTETKDNTTNATDKDSEDKNETTDDSNLSEKTDTGKGWSVPF